METEKHGHLSTSKCKHSASKWFVVCTGSIWTLTYQLNNNKIIQNTNIQQHFQKHSLSKQYLLSCYCWFGIPICVIHQSIKRLIYPLPKHNLWDCSKKYIAVNECPESLQATPLSLILTVIVTIIISFHSNNWQNPTDRIATVLQWATYHQELETTFVQRYSFSHRNPGEMQIHTESLHSIFVRLLFLEALFFPFNGKIQKFIWMFDWLTIYNAWFMWLTPPIFDLITSAKYHITKWILDS